MTLLRCTPTAVYLVFRFLAGYCGAAFLSVAGGSVSDMFSNSDVATFVTLRICSSRVSHIAWDSPMAVYTICPYIGPEIGPIISG